MRSVLSVRSCDSGIQGPENLILNLAEHFQQRGIRYDIANLWDGDPPSVALHEEALSRGLPSQVLQASWGMDPALVSQLRGILDRTQPDVVQAHDAKSAVVSYLASRGMNVGLLGYHYGTLTMHSLRLKLVDASGLFVLRFFHRVLANSPVQQADLLRWRVDPSRIDIVPSFVDTRVIQPPTPAQAAAARQALNLSASQPVLATVARLSANKGHAYMLRALVEVRRRFPEVVYLIVGEGDMDWRGEGGFRGELERLADSLGVAENTRFLGYYPHLETILHATDLLISASLREGMQVSLLEGMAAGRPLVATAVGGTPDAVADGETGLLVPPEDADALAGAVLRLLEDREGARRMGDAARQRVVSRFDVAVVADQVLRICREVAPGD